jgi:hypothetical protein
MSESKSSLTTSEKPKVAYRQNGDDSWTAKITLPNGDIRVHSNKNRKTLDKLVGSRYLAANITWPKKGDALKEAKKELNKKRRLAMEAHRSNRKLLEAENMRVPNIVQDLGPNLLKDCAGMDPAEAKQEIGKAVSEYFAHEVWSIEKEEWEKHMTPEMKGKFVDSFYNKLFPGGTDNEAVTPQAPA